MGFVLREEAENTAWSEVGMSNKGERVINWLRMRRERRKTRHCFKVVFVLREEVVDIVFCCHYKVVMMRLIGNKEQ